jgi:hypothetical protein
MLKKVVPDSLCFLLIVIAYALVVFAFLTFGGLFSRDFLTFYNQRIADVPKHKAFLEEDCGADDQVKKDLTELCYKRGIKMKQDPLLYAFYDTLDTRGFCTDDECFLKKFGKNTLPVILWTILLTFLGLVLVGTCLYQHKKAEPMELPFALRNHVKKKVS